MDKRFVLLIHPDESDAAIKQIHRFDTEMRYEGEYDSIKITVVKTADFSLYGIKDNIVDSEGNIYNRAFH
ncbi:MAG: hypothetical protein LBO67_05570 [Spirochaetaceae bacterium]|nr:hypothetical protein [Spirochaetaceae bacterium]